MGPGDDRGTAALTTVDELQLDGYYPSHATRADLLRRLGRHGEAKTEYDRAASLADRGGARLFPRGGGQGILNLTCPGRSP